MSSGGRKRSGSVGGKAKKAKPSVKKVLLRKQRYNQRFGQPLILRPSPNQGLGFGFPNRLMTKLKFCQTNQMISFVGGVPTKRQYRLNSMNDPDLTGGGHQPYGYDTFMNGSTGCAYQKYKVHAAKWKLVPEARLSDALMGSQTDYTAEYNQAGITDPTSAQAALERAAKWLRVFTNNTSGTAGTDCPSSTGRMSMGGFIRMKDVLGRQLDEYLDAATAAANPTSAVVLNIFAYPQSANTGSGVRAFTIFITYYVEFEMSQQVPDS